MTRKALGRGLEALIPRQTGEVPTPLAAPGRRTAVPLHQIQPSPWQPRRRFDPVRMEELARSIEARGVLEPVLLRPARDGYELVAGERRVRAAQLAGLQEVEAIIVDLDDRGALEAALVENLQREDLTPIEEARAYQMLAEEFGRTHDEIAAEVGKERSTVTNLLRLLKLPDPVLEHVAEGRISAGHARALLPLPSQIEQTEWADRMATEGWSVREAERVIAESLQARDGAKTRRTDPKRDRDPHLGRVEEAVRRRLGAEAKLRMGRRGRGRLELHFVDQDDLERVLDLMGVEIR